MGESFLKRLTLLLIFCGLNGLFLLGAWHLYYRQTPVYQVRKDLHVSEPCFIKALFSPDDKIEKYLIGLIDAECERIALTAFSFTSAPVLEALVKARERDVKIEVVADGQNSATPYSKIYALEGHGIPVWIYPLQARTAKKRQRAGIMHNKFIIFYKNLDNKRLLWSGSFNFSRAAHEINQENVLILDNPSIIDAYARQFEILKKRSRILNLTQT